MPWVLIDWPAQSAAHATRWAVPLNISQAANTASFVPQAHSALQLDRDAMATPPGSPGGDEPLFDSAHPFKGVVVCCTSVPTELRVCFLPLRRVQFVECGSAVCTPSQGVVVVMRSAATASRPRFLPS
jgi:hypothetical protein